MIVYIIKNSWSLCLSLKPGTNLVKKKLKYYKKGSRCTWFRVFNAQKLFYVYFRHLAMKVSEKH